MPTSAALACLGVLGAIAGCFDLKYQNCRITCSDSDGLSCPPGLTCHTIPGDEYGLCAPQGMTCPSQETDAGADAVAMDAGPDATDAMDGGTDADGGSLPPQVLCHAGNCLTLPDAVRSNLVLLLWPSNLPAVGDAVSIWADQSGHGNDAHAIYPSAPPHVTPDGVHLDSTQLGSGFEIADSPSLDFASGDFTVIVLAGLASSNDSVVLFSKSDGARLNSRRVTLWWALSSPSSGRPQGSVNDVQLIAPTDTTQPSVGVYGVRRQADHVELRLNGAVLISDDLPAGSATTSTQDIFLGTGSQVGAVADSIGGVIVVRGAIASDDLRSLESFLSLFVAHP